MDGGFKPRALLHHHVAPALFGKYEIIPPLKFLSGFLSRTFPDFTRSQKIRKKGMQHSHNEAFIAALHIPTLQT